MLRFLSRKLDDVFVADYVPQRLPAASPSTLKSYRITLGFFDRFIGSPARVCDLTNEIVSRFQVARLGEVTRPTVKRDLDNLKALWRFCCRRGLVSVWPELPSISCAAPTPVALTEAEIARVWISIQRETRPVVVSCSPLLEIAAPVYWSALFLVCWDSAERFSAVFNLKERNLDLESRWILFPAESRKGRTKDNVRPISPDTVVALEKLLALYPRRTHSTRVFRWALNRGLVWRRLADIMLRAGLPDSREFKFHAIRKSAASHLCAAGGDPRRLLGHSDARTTDRHYLDPRISADDRAELERLFRPGECG